MEAHEIEQLRRSVAMLPPGHSAGALTKEQAEDLIAELAAITVDNARYLVEELGIVKAADAVDWKALEVLWEDRNAVVHRGGLVDKRHSANTGAERGSMVNLVSRGTYSPACSVASV